MKKITLILCLFPFLHGYSQKETSIPKIDWHYNIKDAIALGKQQNKEVLIYFGMKKCFPCRLVKKYAFDKKEFVDYSRKFIMVRVYDDLDKTNTKNQNYVKTTRAAYNIKSVPTFVLLKKDRTQPSFFAYIKKPQELIDTIEAL